MMRTNKKTSPVAKACTRLLSLVWHEKRTLFVFFVLYTVTSVSSILISVITSKVILDQAMQANASTIHSLLGCAALLFLLLALCDYVSNYMHYVSYGKITGVRIGCLRSVLDKLMTCDYAYLEDARFLNEHQRAIDAPNSSDTGIEYVLKMLFEIPAEVLAVVILAIGIGLQSLWILVAIGIHFGMMLFISKRLEQYQYGRTAEIGKANRRLGYYRNMTGNFGYGKDIRLYRMREKILQHYHQEIDSYIAVVSAVAKAKFLWGLLGLATLLLTDVVAYGVLIRSVLQGMPVSTFTMYISAITLIPALLKSLGEKIKGTLVEGHVVSDYFSFIGLDLASHSGSACAVSGRAPCIEFKNVGFRYPNAEKYVFRDLNLTVKSGERLAIVGPNGVGKSTISKLVSGLFAVTEGEIRIDDKLLSEYASGVLNKMVTVVFQDVHLLAFPLWVNVSCDEQGDRERASAALEQAGLGPVIDQLPRGADQPLLPIIEDDGVQLSGGEAQKVAIARALYKNSGITILDEPTASLDAMAEAEVYLHFDELTKGKTTIFVSHRLASTKFCDKIAYFEDGCMKEYGTHEELMEHKGPYFLMYMMQSKYYASESIEE